MQPPSVSLRWFGRAFLARRGVLCPPASRPPVSPAFTLIELLAVTLIIILLAAAVVGIAGYARLRTYRGKAQADLAVIEQACEAFKTDWGRYPTSSIYRAAYGYDAWVMTLNSSMLGTQLRTGGYVTAVGLTVRPTGAITPTPFCSNVVNVGLWNRTNLLDVIVDPWENPYNYYCTYPRITTESALQLVSSCTYPICTNPGVTNINSTTTTNTAYIGGQVNVTYDLWSYGPDRQSARGSTPSLTWIDDIGNLER
ncbi:hypothetical protein HQ590_10120 [bacterium]|nr:hypothetical protein [bacterium]